MRESLERASAESSGIGMYLLAMYYFLANNFSVVVIIFGFGMIGFGATLMSGIPVGYIQHDVLAAMFGVWGASLVVLGIIIYAIFWFNRLMARLQTDTGSEQSRETDAEPDADAGTDLSL